MKWDVHGERAVYESEWVRLMLADVELPDGHRFDHHVVRIAAASGVVVSDADRGVLLLWRHRFITDSWGWEIPAGRIDAGETPADAGVRETLEETGWRPGPLRELTTYHPLNGTSDARFHLFIADGAVHEGDPTDPYESERIEWVQWPSIRDEIAAGRVPDGLSLTALLWAMTFRDR
jgi:8-oxo-dGTP pyrophosphatase MutT (NUDIX family)